MYQPTHPQTHAAKESGSLYQSEAGSNYLAARRDAEVQGKDPDVVFGPVVHESPGMAAASSHGVAVGAYPGEHPHASTYESEGGSNFLSAERYQEQLAAHHQPLPGQQFHQHQQEQLPASAVRHKEQLVNSSQAQAQAAEADRDIWGPIVHPSKQM